MLNLSPLSQLYQQAQLAQAREDYAQALQLYEDLLEEIGQQTADSVQRDMRLAALRAQGNLWHRLGDQQNCLTCFERYYLEAGTSVRAIDALALIGRQHTQMGQYKKALGAHREALQVASALNDTDGRAKAYSGIGGALYGLGRYEEVLPNLEKALALFSQLQDRYQQIRVWNQLGLNYMYTGQIDKSIAVLEEALKLEDALGLWEKAIILGNLGEAYQWLFNMEKALVYHRQAMALAEDIHSPTAVADICRNIGVDLVYLGELESGIRHLYTALALSEDTGQPDIKMQTLYSLALAELQQGNTVTAHEHAQALYDMAEKGQTIGHSANAYHALGLCQREMGEMTAARQLWQHGVLMAHSAGKQMLIWQLHAALAEIAPTNNLAHIHNRMAAEMIDQIVFPIEDESLRQVFLDAPPVQAVLAQQLSEQG
jgi:tetratricopeptide (TPR) repeat protein